ncbi:DNA-processing protein DprA [Cytobacillus gottheilii]|uniref:DNA-processing protein DprA n=1 Tax=Cytobacillus gottheilii TaxID=859144 RepID=A0ABX8FGZ9_9BACI|nr:DNA-processing protein DprA [Cytobacillus gottheilii]QVY63278.1 DNA-processing protein DprA [Cytobacillus gottheilii]
MDEFTRRLSHLQQCRGIGWKTIYHMIKVNPTLSDLYEQNFLQHFSSLFKSSQLFNTALFDLHTDVILKKISLYDQHHINLITIADQCYPQRLKETFQPPWVLYAKGNRSLLNHNDCLAVVGSREATTYGQKAIKCLFPKLISEKVVIVSGLAAGIDTIAHETAIKEGGQTIAIIAGGFFNIYPKENTSLAEHIMKDHLLLSEYAPDSKPARWQFPQRNRIISGISKATLVVQAKRRSGSLITASTALNEGRDVFAIPGDITDPAYEGTNEIIQKGAKLIIRAEDILEELRYN